MFRPSFLFLTMTIFLMGPLHAQGEGGVFTQSRLAALKTGEGSLGNNPAGIEWFNELRRKTAALGRESEVKLEDIEGTVYLNEQFVQGKVFYNDAFYESFMLRYDAYNDEVEIQRGSSNSLEALHKSLAISCEILGDRLRYMEYLGKKQESRRGYLIVLVEGQSYSLYKRYAKIFKEAKPAKTSLQASFPHRFVDEIEYYLKQEGKNPRYLKLKKSSVLEMLANGPSEKIKHYMKANKIDLGSEEQLLQLVSHANTISSQ